MCYVLISLDNHPLDRNSYFMQCRYDNIMSFSISTKLIKEEIGSIIYNIFFCTHYSVTIVLLVNYKLNGVFPL